MFFLDCLLGKPTSFQRDHSQTKPYSKYAPGLQHIAIIVKNRELTLYTLVNYGSIHFSESKNKSLRILRNNSTVLKYKTKLT